MAHKITFTRNIPDNLAHSLSEEGNLIAQKYNLSFESHIEDGLENCTIIFESREIADSYLSEMANSGEADKTGHYRSDLIREDI